MQNKLPQISVIMPVYNGEPYLERAVQSILDQTYKNFELILINDGSTDNSPQILENFAKSDKRIRLINQPNQGLIKTLNTGIAEAKAPLIARMDADDIAFPDRFKIQKNHMENHPNITALGSAIIVIDENDNQADTVYYPPNGKQLDTYILKNGSPLAHPAVMMQTQAIKDLGGYKELFRHAEDYELWLRLHKHGQIHNIQEPLLYYRHHQDKISVNHAKEQALVSVVARHLSKESTVSSKGWRKIDNSTLDKFQTGRAALEIEILDIIATSVLLSPSLENINKIKQEIPTKVPRNATHFASRIYAKIALAYLKNKNIPSALLYILKATILNPKTLMLTAFKRYKPR